MGRDRSDGEILLLMTDAKVRAAVVEGSAPDDIRPMGRQSNTLDDSALRRSNAPRVIYQRRNTASHIYLTLSLFLCRYTLHTRGRTGRLSVTQSLARRLGLQLVQTHKSQRSAAVLQLKSDGQITEIEDTRPMCALSDHSTRYFAGPASPSTNCG